MATAIRQAEPALRIPRIPETGRRGSTAKPNPHRPLTDLQPLGLRGKREAVFLVTQTDLGGERGSIDASPPPVRRGDP